MQRLINWEQKITKLGKVTMQISVENARSSSRHVSLQKMKRSVNFSNNLPTFASKLYLQTCTV